ncbi:restriction endonuclease subunit S [Escherichia coli]|uniref:restriction endonuclease subunit S n=1 Tax=Escherichia coli TaxID=562 RepID=UPI0025A67B47|nr:restriction endonuclease subunit S [Escherichia coli]MDS1688576.1 restriction endonuclease subunit S [Escherichia coli]
MKKLSEIFFIYMGNKLDLNKMKISDTCDGVNFVSRTAKQNGITTKVEQLPDVPPFEKGLITVALGGSVLSTFLQYDDFYTGQNVAVLEPKNSMTNAEKLYYCLLISHNAYRYSACGREANKTLKELMLPDISELPSWINRVYDEFNIVFSNDSFSAVESIEFDTDTWKSFRYDDIFHIERGESLYIKDLKDGIYPYISAISENNGIQRYCSVFNQKGNAITLSYDGSIGEAFYQPSEFFASEKIAVLRLNSKWGAELNEFIAFFLITLIRKEKFRFNYGLKWSINSRMKKSVIRLPVVNDYPDWLYMEKYIKMLPYSCNLRII